MNKPFFGAEDFTCPGSPFIFDKSQRVLLANIANEKLIRLGRPVYTMRVPGNDSMVCNQANAHQKWVMVLVEDLLNCSHPKEKISEMTPDWEGIIRMTPDQAVQAMKNLYYKRYYCNACGKTVTPVDFK